MIILILSCENTKDVVIYVYIMGCCVHCFRSFFSLRKVVLCTKISIVKKDKS